MWSCFLENVYDVFTHQYQQISIGHGPKGHPRHFRQVSVLCIVSCNKSCFVFANEELPYMIKPLKRRRDKIG